MSSVISIFSGTDGWLIIQYQMCVSLVSVRGSPVAYLLTEYSLNLLLLVTYCCYYNNSNK